MDFSFNCSTISHPSWPALTASIRAGSISARVTRFTPVRSSPSASILARPLATWVSTLPPPGTTPSSTAERVARSASSVRVLRYLSSVSLGAPSLTTAPHLLGDLLQHRQQVFDRGDLLVGDEDEGIFQHRLHLLGVGHKVRGDIALVEHHPLDHLDRRLDTLALLDGDHAIFADLVHGVGDEAAHRGIVGGDAGHRLDRVLGLDRLGDLADLLHRHSDGAVDAAL